MTVPAYNITAGAYTGNGLQDTYDYDFPIQEASEIKVLQKNLDGSEEQLVLNVDYSVDVGETGGTVTRLAGNLPDGVQWFFVCNIDPTQETAFNSQGGFFPDVHEDSFDKLTLLIQQLVKDTMRAFKVSEFVGAEGDFDTQIPEIKATEGIRFNDAGDGLTTFPITFAQQAALLAEIAARIAGDDSLQSQIVNLYNGYTAADANIQAQLTGEVPLEASAFSPISWHDQVIETSVTIPDNKNAWSFGPSITIADGVSVTVGEGSSWTIADGEVTP
jgi:hypothetical protein